MPLASVRLAAVAISVALAALIGAGVARADGDPASDVLYSGHVFFPYGSPISTSAQKTLENTVEASHKAGYPIRVAVIATPIDLGAVTSLWKQPQKYATFLALELSFVYRGPLLIVMPSGLGFAHYKQKIGADEAVLAHIPVAGGGDGLAVTATRAVRALAARGGHPLGTVSASGSPWKSPVVPAAIGLAILGVAAGVLFWRRRADAPRPGR